MMILKITKSLKKIICLFELMVKRKVYITSIIIFLQIADLGKGKAQTPYPRAGGHYTFIKCPVIYICRAFLIRTVPRRERRKMINTEPIEKILKVALASGRLKDDRPLSIIIIAHPA
jgi:hypothetical protein